MKLGEKLKIMRGDKSRSYISNKLGISKSSWAMYERNERVPRDSIKIRIAEFFKSTVQDIFFDDAEH